MASTAPAMPQHLQALQRANEVRDERARLKRDLKAGRKTLAQALEDPCVAKMEVVDLLKCLPRWGRHHAMRALAPEYISPNRLVGTLTERQRKALVERAR